MEFFMSLELPGNSMSKSCHPNGSWKEIKTLKTNKVNDAILQQVIYWLTNSDMMTTFTVVFLTDLTLSINRLTHQQSVVLFMSRVIPLPMKLHWAVSGGMFMPFNPNELVLILLNFRKNCCGVSCCYGEMWRLHWIETSSRISQYPRKSYGGTLCLCFLYDKLFTSGKLVVSQIQAVLPNINVARDLANNIPKCIRAIWVSYRAIMSILSNLTVRHSMKTMFLISWMCSIHAASKHYKSTW